MTEQHPITPPPELLDQWLKIPEVVTPITKMAVVTVTTNRLQMLATESARWGADQELDACCEWLVEQGWFGSSDAEALMLLRSARRPKPPSLKEQALQALCRFMDPEGHDDCSVKDVDDDFDTIRRALEQLDD